MLEKMLIDNKKYKKLYKTKALLIFFIIPLVIELILLRMMVSITPINEGFILPVIIGGMYIPGSIIVGLTFYFSFMMKYSFTGFVIEDSKLQFVLAHKWNNPKGASFYMHDIQSVSSYSITNKKITINGHIIKQLVDEGKPDKKYDKTVLNTISVINVFENINILENYLIGNKASKQ